MNQPTIDPNIPFAADLRQEDLPGLSYPPPAQIQAAVNDPLLGLNLGILTLLLNRRIIDPNLRDTYNIQWNFALQQQFGSSWAAQATYVGKLECKDEQYT